MVVLPLGNTTILHFSNTLPNPDVFHYIPLQFLIYPPKHPLPQTKSRITKHPNSYQVTGQPTYIHLPHAPTKQCVLGDCALFIRGSGGEVELKSERHIEKCYAVPPPLSTKASCKFSSDLLPVFHEITTNPIPPNGGDTLSVIYFL